MNNVTFSNVNRKMSTSGRVTRIPLLVCQRKLFHVLFYIFFQILFLVLFYTLLVVLFNTVSCYILFHTLLLDIYSTYMFNNLPS